jgi:hypothetical protein
MHNRMQRSIFHRHHRHPYRNAKHRLDFYGLGRRVHRHRDNLYRHPDGGRSRRNRNVQPLNKIEAEHQSSASKLLM